MIFIEFVIYLRSLMKKKSAFFLLHSSNMVYSIFEVKYGYVSFLAIHLNKIGFLAAYKFYVAIKLGIKHSSDLVNSELSLWPNFGKIM